MNPPPRADAATVTACVPAWNAEQHIEATLQSLLAQDHQPLEILVSVDLSEDGTLALCEQLARRYSSIKVVAQTERLGWIANVNYLLDKAQGEYLFIASHDDQWSIKFASTLLAALRDKPSAALAYCDLHWIEQGREQVQNYRAGSMKTLWPRACAMLLQAGRWWVPYRGLLRREAIRDCGGLRSSEAGEFSADWPWLLRLSMWGYFVRVAQPLCEKHLHERNLSKRWSYSLRQWLLLDRQCRSAIRNADIHPISQIGLLAVSMLLPLRHALGVMVTRLRAHR